MLQFKLKTINIFHFNEIILHRNEIVNTYFHFNEMFWDQFIEQCKKINMKPSQVAIDNQIPVGSITAWKKGTEPNTKTLIKLADYFGLSTDYLLGRSGKDPDLPDDEKELIQNYRKLSDEGKRIIRNQVKAAVPEEAPTKTAETA